ncbi:MAG: DUF438 domain-containing protein [Vallitaleaceae bacterium]|jgi:DUF438 domain-containing protein|nr:DUF438 domain-containing protein [Vallitaleaceae bacterium]
MSELINNQEQKQVKLKALIKRLHEGATVEEVREEFDQLTVGVTAIEITVMEQALVNEGLPVEAIQRLCDVHASVFKGSIEEIHQEVGYEIPGLDEGHPVHTFKKENRVIEDHLENQVLRFLSDYTENKSEATRSKLEDSLKKLATIDRHYSRKENLLFPYMEKYDITAPPKVMWGVDDEIRGKIKAVISLIGQEAVNVPSLNQLVRELVHQTNEMIFKEEEILFPMVLETFTQQEWIAIEKASAEIGFTMIHTVNRWMTAVLSKEDVEVPVTVSNDGNSVVADSVNQIGIVGKDSQAVIPFDAGSLTVEEVNAILNTVPLDMTFVGADDRVKYFTQGKERVFDRPITIIGREVKNCHPPKSVHIVEQIVADLKSGKKDNEDFWIKMGPMFVYIRYFAVRNKTGEFLGTLEVTQNIKPITELEGEKRLRDEENEG